MLSRGPCRESSKYSYQDVYDTSTFFAEEKPALFMSAPSNGGDEEPTRFGNPLDDGHVEQWAEEADPDAVPV